MFRNGPGKIKICFQLSINIKLIRVVKTTGGSYHDTYKVRPNVVLSVGTDERLCLTLAAFQIIGLDSFAMYE
jgi:hypothetical protein